jgi:hypothetical protein
MKKKEIENGQKKVKPKVEDKSIKVTKNSSLIFGSKTK